MLYALPRPLFATMTITVTLTAIATVAVAASILSLYAWLHIAPGFML